MHGDWGGTRNHKQLTTTHSQTMADQAMTTSSAAVSGRHRRARTPLARIAPLIALVLIVLAGVAILLAWLFISPKRLVYTVEDATVHSVDISHDRRLNATFHVVLRAYNPNRHVSVYYDSIQTSVSYEDDKVAEGTEEPFLQGHRSTRRLGVTVEAHAAAMADEAARQLRVERASGEVEVGVKLRARIRFKVGIWKSRHRTLEVSCFPVLAHFSLTKPFDRTHCDVDV